MTFTTALFFSLALYSALKSLCLPELDLSRMCGTGLFDAEHRASEKNRASERYKASCE